ACLAKRSRTRDAARRNGGGRSRVENRERFLEGLSRMLNLVLALLAGVITIAAPCTLPMLPILLGASVGQTSKARPVMIAAGFVLSFSLVALALGAITRVFDFDPNSLRNGAAVLLVAFGLLMIWPAPFEWLTGRIGG